MHGVVGLGHEGRVPVVDGVVLGGDAAHVGGEGEDVGVGDGLGVSEKSHDLRVRPARPGA